MSHLARTLARIGSREALYWIFPLTAGAGWLVWPAVDDDWKLERGLMRDPEADVNYVANLKKHGCHHQEQLPTDDPPTSES